MKPHTESGNAARPQPRSLPAEAAQLCAPRAPGSAERTERLPTPAFGVKGGPISP